MWVKEVGLELEQICEFFRRLSNYFVKSYYKTVIMTSKRITNVSKEYHLLRLRKIQEMLKTIKDNPKELLDE